MGHYIYKYVLNNEIIYVGKNNTNLIERINQHAAEERFAQYNGDIEIYYIEVTSGFTSEALETLLIQKYQPVMNTEKKGEKLMIEFVEPEWKNYEEYKKEYELQREHNSKLGNVLLERKKRKAIRLQKEERYHELQKQFFLNCFEAAVSGKSSLPLNIKDSWHKEFYELMIELKKGPAEALHFEWRNGYAFRHWIKSVNISPDIMTVEWDNGEIIFGLHARHLFTLLYQGYSVLDLENEFPFKELVVIESH